MKSHLKSYNLKLITISPLFIGSGKEINKKEYVYDRNNNIVYILDSSKFTSFLLKNNLIEDYSDFMLSNMNDLFRWMFSTKKIKQSDIKSFSSYSVNISDALKHNPNLRGIHLFIKDNYLKAYIPGSSIKGALRTAILAKLIMNNQEQERFNMKKLIENIQNMHKREFISTLNRENSQVENKYLHKLNLEDTAHNNMLNSVMRGLQVSDSESIDSNNLILTAKLDLTVAGKIKPIPTFRESIKPQVTINSKLTLDEHILSTAGIDIAFIQVALKEFVDLQEEIFYSSFKEPPNADKSRASNGTEMYLGGGVGYFSKSITYPRGGKLALELVARLMSEQFPRHSHDKDVEIGVSPHTLKGTYYNDKFYRMGRCAVEIS